MSVLDDEANGAAVAAVATVLSDPHVSNRGSVGGTFGIDSDADVAVAPEAASTSPSRLDGPSQDALARPRGGLPSMVTRARAALDVADGAYPGFVRCLRF